MNLRHGVPKNWRTDTNPAAIATLSLEFIMLSRLTGDHFFIFHSSPSGDTVYESVSRMALRSLWGRRDPRTGLLGSSIDVNTGMANSLHLS